MLIPDFEATINGVDYGIVVTQYEVTPPWTGSLMSAPSDLDYHGFVEWGFIVIDENGDEVDIEIDSATEDRLLERYENLIGD